MKYKYCKECGKFHKDICGHMLKLETYDAGYLNDYGGGDVSWWHNYIRAELERAHEFYQSQLE